MSLTVFSSTTSSRAISLLDRAARDQAQYVKPRAVSGQFGIEVLGEAATLPSDTNSLSVACPAQRSGRDDHVPPTPPGKARAVGDLAAGSMPGPATRPGPVGTAGHRQVC